MDNESWTFVLYTVLLLTQQNPFQLDFFFMNALIDSSNGRFIIFAHWRAQILHQGDFILATKVNKFDMSHFGVEINTTAIRIDTSSRRMQISVQIVGNVSGKDGNFLHADYPSRQFQKTRWLESHFSDESDH